MLIYAISSLCSQENVSPPQTENKENHEDGNKLSREKYSIWNNSKRGLQVKEDQCYLILKKRVCMQQLSVIKADTEQNKIH